MTVKEIYDNLESFTGDQRAEHLGNLSRQFSDVSMGDLVNFQDNWSPSKGMEAFFAEQGKLFKKCINLEVSNFGKTVREALGLEPLTWDTEII